MPDQIDLRSDTVTLPPPEMRRAMYDAELGDDVYGEDPTVNRLQERAAALLGMEAALFVASGTMGNLLAALTHCRRGDEIVAGDQAHIFLYEAGGSSVLGATAMRPLPTLPDGMLPLDQLGASLHDRSDAHEAGTGLLCLENTHNRRGGAVLPPAYVAQVRAIANAAGVPVHLDGARIFNAAVALGLPVSELVREVDSVTFCFSKGLAAPVGSMLCGSRAFIAAAHRWRKMVGGGTRQAGVLAAAGLYALEHMVDRLAEDHANARVLAAGLVELPGVSLAQAEVQTNIVIVDVAGTGLTAAEFMARLRAEGVYCGGFGSSLIRFVTHYGIERIHVEQALRAMRRALEVAPAIA